MGSVYPAAVSPTLLPRVRRAPSKGEGKKAILDEKFAP